MPLGCGCRRPGFEPGSQRLVLNLFFPAAYPAIKWGPGFGWVVSRASLSPTVDERLARETKRRYLQQPRPLEACTYGKLTHRQITGGKSQRSMNEDLEQCMAH